MPRSAWLAVGAVLATLLSAGLGTRGGAIAVALGAATACLAFAGTRRTRRVAVALGIGAIALGLRVVAGPAPPAMDGAPEGRGPWTMLVESVGSPREGRQVATLRTPVDGMDGFRLAATLPRFPAVEPGDTVRVGGGTRPRPDSPYGQYLARLRAWGTLDARTLEVLPAAGGPGRLLERVRRAAADSLASVLPEPEAGLAAGILIGLRDRVDRAVAASFTTAGVSHVVAISGWNIAIVAAAVAAVAGRLGRRRRAVVTIVAIAAYIAFAGASPSVLRAGAMAGVVLLARETGRAGYAASALGWAVVVLLLVDPGLVGDAGFQLSTVATAGLIAWATPLTVRLDGIAAGRAPRWLTESLGVSLAAQAATLPVVLASFGRLAIIAPAVNLAVVPLVAPAMAAGIVAFLGAGLVAAGAPTLVGAALAAPAWVALRLMVAIVAWSAAVPGASLTLEPPLGAVTALASVIAGGLIAWHRRRPARRRPRSAAATDPPTVRTGRHGPPGPSRLARWSAIGLVVALGVTAGVAAMRPAGVARVTILDVGQGDAILVEGSSGGRLLIDGGPDPDRLLVVLDRRLPPWDRRLDAVVLSHPHEDHVAGLALLLARYRVARVFEPGMRGPGPGYGAWAAALRRPGAPERHALAAGDRLTVDDIRLAVLWPDRGQVPADPPDTGTGINNVSIVVLGEVAGRRFLLTGDIEEGIDPVVVARGLPHVDLLKVAHHGSRTATTEAFVAATRPTVAVASAGADNRYGHPARTTLDRLRSAGARVYRTDQDGTVTVTLATDGVSIRREPRPAAERPPRATAEARSAAAPRGFVCAIPTGFGATDGSPDRASGGGPTPSGALAAAAPTRRAEDPGDRPGRRLGYHRADDGPLAAGGRGPAVLPRSTALGTRACARRGRGRGLAGPSDRAPRDRPGSGRGGVGRPSARRRQAPPVRGSGAGPPPR